MNTVKHFLLTSALIIVLYVSSLAQSEQSLGMMENLYQATYTNPIALPQHEISIGLPGISSVYGGLTNTGFTYKQLVMGDSLNPDNAISKMKKKNFLYAGVQTDLFHFRIKVRHSYLSFNISEKASFRFSYPKDLFALGWQGDYQFAGSQVQLSSLGVDLNYYREYALGYTKEKRNWIFGGKFKVLQGIANAHMSNKNSNLNIQQGTYDLSFSTDITMYTSGMYNSNVNANYFTQFQNKGLGLDLAVGYKYKEKWTFSASLINLGFIHWKRDVQDYSVKGNAVFQGIEVYANSSGSGVNVPDSLQKSFQTSQGASAYTSWLLPQLYLRTSYKLTKTTSLNGCFYMEKYKALRPALTLGVTQRVGRIFSFLLSSNYQYSRLNAGLGFMLKPGPFQFYFISDNIFRTYTYSTDPFIIIPKNAKTLSVRVGMNLVFGRVRGPEKQTLPK